jgi:hypothetical protein
MAGKMGRRDLLLLEMTLHALAVGVTLETLTFVHGIDPDDAGPLGPADAQHMTPCGRPQLRVYRTSIRWFGDDVVRARKGSAMRVH